MPGMAGMSGMAGTPGMATTPGSVAHGLAGNGASRTHAVGHAMAGMGMGAAPRVDAHTILTDWQVSVFAVGAGAVLVVIAVWYLVSVRALAARGRRWSRWRTVSFLCGLVAVELALGSSVAVLAGYTFTAHIAQHLLLMVIAPPLGALGAPMTLALQTSRRPTKRRLLAALRSAPFRVISHPVPVFFMYYLSMYAFFLTGALGYAMTHMWVMDLVNLGFLGGATLFWWPMVGIDPIPHWNMNPGLKLLNLLIGVPVESFLGVALLMKATPAAPMYSLATTHFGGGVLWVATEVATVAALLPIYTQVTLRRTPAPPDASTPAWPPATASNRPSSKATACSRPSKRYAVTDRRRRPDGRSRTALAARCVSVPHPRAAARLRHHRRFCRQFGGGARSGSRERSPALRRRQTKARWRVPMSTSRLWGMARRRRGGGIGWLAADGGAVFMFR